MEKNIWVKNRTYKESNERRIVHAKNHMYEKSCIWRIEYEQKIEREKIHVGNQVCQASFKIDESFVRTMSRV